MEESEREREREDICATFPDSKKIKNEKESLLLSLFLIWAFGSRSRQKL